jgi:hypothetical protein
MSREKYDAQSGKDSNHSNSKLSNKSHPLLGITSIFTKMKNKLSDLLFINYEDGREESGKKRIENLSYLKIKNENKNNFHHPYYLENLYIKPSYINENEHIYDAPSIHADRNHTSHFEMNLNNIQSEGNQNLYRDDYSTGRKSEVINRRFSLDSSRNKKKVNPLLKIATYITNKKFNPESIEKDKISQRDGYNAYDYMNHDNHYNQSHYSKTLNRSAFKLLGDTKTVALDNKKIINYNDFNEMLKGRNIIRPVPIRDTDLKNKRGREKYEIEKDIKSHDAMSIVDNQYNPDNQSMKKRRIDTTENSSIFSSVNYINKIKSYQRDDVSMRSINSALQSNRKSDVSMQIRPSENKSILSNRSNYQTKTIDEIRREIEEKRNSHKNMFDEMSRRSQRRHDKEKELSYEERKRILTNYYKERQKAPENTEFLSHKNVQFAPVDYDLTRDHKYSLSKSQINIEASPRNKPVVMEKKEEINIISKKIEKIEEKKIENINNITPSGGLFNFGAPTTTTTAKVEEKEKEKPSTFSFGASITSTTSSLFNAPPKNDENKSTNISSLTNASNKSNLFTKPDEATKSTISFTSISQANSLTEKKEKPEDKEEKDFGKITQPEKKEEEKKSTLFSGFGAPIGTTSTSTSGFKGIGTINAANTATTATTTATPAFEFGPKTEIKPTETKLNTLTSTPTTLFSATGTTSINAPTTTLFGQPSTSTTTVTSAATQESKPLLFAEKTLPVFGGDKKETTTGSIFGNKLQDISKANDKTGLNNISNVATSTSTATASTPFSGFAAIKPTNTTTNVEKSKEEVKQPETKTENKPLFGGFTGFPDAPKKEVTQSTIAASTTATEPAKVGLFVTSTTVTASATSSSLFSINKPAEQTTKSETKPVEEKKDIVSPFSSKITTTEASKPDVKPEDINKPALGNFPSGSLFSNTPLATSVPLQTAQSSSSSTLFTGSKPSFPSTSIGQFNSNTNNNTVEAPNTKPTSTVTESNSTSTNLCNNSNPFLAATFNNVVKNNLFSSPVKNTQSEPSSINSNSTNAFLPKNSINQQNKNRDMFGNVQGTPFGNNIPSSNPLGGLNFGQGMGQGFGQSTNMFNANTTNNDGDMAISPVTSPKFPFKNEGILSGNNIAPLGSTTTSGIFGINSSNSKNLFYNFLASGPLGGSLGQPNSVFPSPQGQSGNTNIFSSQPTGGMGLGGSLNNSSGFNSLNTASNPFTTNSNTSTPNFFNQNVSGNSLQPAQGGLFGNSNNTTPAFGQSQQPGGIFGAPSNLPTSGGLTFSLGKKDKK